MKRILFGVIGAFCLLLPVSALAANFRVPADQQQNLTIGTGETHKNLYTAGSAISVDANIGKDLTAAGGTVNVNGNVADDLFVGGGNLFIKGNVGGSARVGGGTIQFDGVIADDLLAAGGMVTLTESGKVGGDLLVGAGTLDLSGVVSGDAKIGGGDVTINGTVGGDVLIRGAQKVTIGDKAKISGKLTYYSTAAANISSSAVIGKGVDFHQEKTAERTSAAASGIVYSIISAFILVLLLVYVLPRQSKEFLAASFANFLPNFGWGVLALFAAPIAFVILLALTFTVKLAFAMLMLYILLLLIASVFVPLMTGVWIYRQIKKGENFRIDWLTALIGVLIAALVGIIPVVGSLAIFVIFASALGTLITFVFRPLKK